MPNTTAHSYQSDSSGHIGSKGVRTRGNPLPGTDHGNRRYDKRLWPTACPPYKGKHAIITSLHRTQLTRLTLKCGHSSSRCVVKCNTQLARHPRLPSTQKTPTKCGEFKANVLMYRVERKKHKMYKGSVIKCNLIHGFYLKILHLVSGLPGKQYTCATVIVTRK